MAGKDIWHIRARDNFFRSWHLAALFKFNIQSNDGGEDGSDKIMAGSIVEEET